MGNNPSKPDVPSAAGSPYVTGSGHEKKVTQQSSINTLSGTTTKAAAADPSATKETAIGYSATQNQAAVQQHPQSSQPTEPSARTLDQPDHQDAKILDPEPRGIPTPDPSNPVQVPNPRMRRDTLPPGMAPQSYYNASAHLQRPPRMPLPIGDATATPGSPLLGPEDSHIGGDLTHDRFVDEQTGHEQSSVPVDEDEGAEDLAPYTPSGVGKAVPTTIEWASHGDKVYVTGTFVNWEKKFRLHRRYVALFLIPYLCLLEPSTTFPETSRLHAIGVNILLADVETFQSGTFLVSFFHTSSIGLVFDIPDMLIAVC